MVAAARRRVQVEDRAERPKDADVVGWNKLFVGTLCPGDKNDELRNYLKAMTEKAWPLVNWLTHHRNASKTSAIIAMDAVDAIIKHYACLLNRKRANHLEQCPRCKSRNVRTFFDNAIEPDGQYFQSCGICDWDSHPGIAEDDEERG